MGENADDLVEGMVCSWCGLFFAEPHGYPVLCHECYDGATKKERGGLPRATIRELCDTTEDE